MLLYYLFLDCFWNAYIRNCTAHIQIILYECEIALLHYLPKGWKMAHQPKVLFFLFFYLRWYLILVSYWFFENHSKIFGHRGGLGGATKGVSCRRRTIFPFRGLMAILLLLNRQFETSLLLFYISRRTCLWNGRCLHQPPLLFFLWNDYLHIFLFLWIS